MERRTAVVSWYSPIKKFGFLQMEDTDGQSASVFMHERALIGGGGSILDPKPGDKVEFFLYQTERGFQARRAVVIE